MPPSLTSTIRQRCVLHYLYLPLRDRALLGGEADADLYNAAAVGFVGDGIALVVNLL